MQIKIFAGSQILIGNILRAFFHPPPPWKEKILLGLLDPKYQKWPFCQYLKWDCENYLFEDYHLKSGIAIWIHGLMTSGSNPRTDTPWCLQNRQLTTAKTNGTYQEDWRVPMIINRTLPATDRFLWIFLGTHPLILNRNRENHSRKSQYSPMGELNHRMRLAEALSTRRVDLRYLFQKRNQEWG